MTEPVLFWNHLALEANRMDHTGQMKGKNQRGPTLSARALAMLHIAIHDACVLYYTAPVYAPWLTDAKLPGDAKKTRDEITMAIAGAAHTLLKDLYPAQVDIFDGHLAAVRAGVAWTPIIAGALEFGKSVGDRIIMKRQNDKNNDPPEKPMEKKNGYHQDDPFNSPQPLLGEDFGKTDHFSMKDGHIKSSAPPGYLGNALDPKSPTYQQYLNDFEQVKELGAKRGGRKPDQTISGLFWAYDGVSEIGTPPRLYNQIAVQLLSKSAASLTPEARTLFLARSLMLINVAMAEAGTEAWYNKFTFNMWRPVVGIRAHGVGLGSEGGATAAIDPRADPFWEPLGAPNSNTIGKDFTPPFPAYPSGHATFGAAAFEMIRLINKVPPSQPDTIAFEFVSDEMNGQTKDSQGTVRPRRKMHFNSLLEAMFANGLSRVYLGVHWRFDATSATKAEEILTVNDNIGGIPLGRAIATQVFDNMRGI